MSKVQRLGNNSNDVIRQNAWAKWRSSGAIGRESYEKALSWYTTIGGTAFEQKVRQEGKRCGIKLTKTDRDIEKIKLENLKGEYTMIHQMSRMFGQPLTEAGKKRLREIGDFFGCPREEVEEQIRQTEIMTAQVTPREIFHIRISPDDVFNT